MERCCNYGDWLDSLEDLYTTLARIPVFDEDSLVSYCSYEMSAHCHSHKDFCSQGCYHFLRMQPHEQVLIFMNFYLLESAGIHHTKDSSYCELIWFFRKTRPAF